MVGTKQIGEVKNSIGNVEAKELICTTHGHELSVGWRGVVGWRECRGLREKRGGWERMGEKAQVIRSINGRYEIDRRRLRVVWEMEKPKNLYV